MWGTTLQLADAWGCPPWEVEDHPDSAYWAARWAIYRKELQAAQERKTKPRED